LTFEELPELVEIDEGRERVREQGLSIPCVQSRGAMERGGQGLKIWEDGGKRKSGEYPE
jgi:hypothetical protein